MLVQDTFLHGLHSAMQGLDTKQPCSELEAAQGCQVSAASPVTVRSLLGRLEACSTGLQQQQQLTVLQQAAVQAQLVPSLHASFGALQPQIFPAKQLQHAELSMPELLDRIDELLLSNTQLADSVKDMEADIKTHANIIQQRGAPLQAERRVLTAFHTDPAWLATQVTA